jgi:hypothetical protein
MMPYKEVKYKVTDPFGNVEEGAIINALLIAEDPPCGLIYHPHVRGECSSFEICYKDNI